MKFEWEGELPTHPTVEHIQESLEGDLEHLYDPRGLCPLVVSIYLRQDPMKLRVEGVGYSKDKEPLVIFHYALVSPGGSWWDYCDNPIRQKS